MSRYDAFGNMEMDQIWDFFINYDICSEETLNVVTSINGYSPETMADILYATTGLRNIEQVIDEFGLDPEDFGFDSEDEDEDEY